METVDPRPVEQLTQAELRIRIEQRCRRITCLLKDMIYLAPDEDQREFYQDFLNEWTEIESR